MLEEQVKSDFRSKIFANKKLIFWVTIGILLFIAIITETLFYLSRSKSAQQQVVPRSKEAGSSETEEGLTREQGEGGTASNLSITPVDTTLTPQITISISNKEIVGNILVWLNKTRIFGRILTSYTASGKFISDGGYAEGEDCNTENECNIKDPANYIGLTATWARFKYYEKYKTPRDLMIIKNDFAVYADTKKISAIQPTFWSIKFLYEMWKSPLFTSSDRQNIEKIIYRVAHNPEILGPSEDAVKEKGKAEELDLSQFKNKRFDYQDKTVNIQNLNLYAFTSSDYVYSFLFLKEKKNSLNPEDYLNIAIDLFNKGVIAYAKSDNLNGNSSSPYLLGVAAVDIYKVTNKPQYLDYAQYLFNTHKEQQCLNVESCALSAAFSLDLYNLTNQNEYKTFTENIVEYLYANFYDLETLGGFKYNKGVFYQIIGKERSYLLMPNAVLIIVLISL